MLISNEVTTVRTVSMTTVESGPPGESRDLSNGRYSNGCNSQDPAQELIRSCLAFRRLRNPTRLISIAVSFNPQRVLFLAVPSAPASNVVSAARLEAWRNNDQRKPWRENAADFWATDKRNRIGNKHSLSAIHSVDLRC